MHQWVLYLSQNTDQWSTASLSQIFMFPAHLSRLLSSHDEETTRKYASGFSVIFMQISMCCLLILLVLCQIPPRLLLKLACTLTCSVNIYNVADSLQTLMLTIFLSGDGLVIHDNARECHVRVTQDLLNEIRWIQILHYPKLFRFKLYWAIMVSNRTK